MCTPLKRKIDRGIVGAFVGACLGFMIAIVFAVIVTEFVTPALKITISPLSHLQTMLAFGLPALIGAIIGFIREFKRMQHQIDGENITRYC